MKKYLHPITLFLALGVAFVLPSYWWQFELAVNPINSESINKGDITLFSTQWCPYCTKARHFLRTANIPFTELDVEQSPDAFKQLQKISNGAVPVIQVGERVVQGFNRDAIRDAINHFSSTAAR